ncbi:MAG: hypothetical protein MK135_00740 [Polyangiaceae bacterium]|nr:hypothetical protein [Polyangiaceae bacterium]
MVPIDHADDDVRRALLGGDYRRTLSDWHVVTASLRNIDSSAFRREQHDSG